MTVSRAYEPEPTAEFTLEWVVRQFRRIAVAIGQGDAGNGRTRRIKAVDSSVDTTYNVTNDDEVILVDSTAAAVTVNLTNPADQRELIIKNFSSSTGNNVTVSPDGSDDIDYNGTDSTVTVGNALHLIYSADEANHFTI